jgi:hypothetical protein
MMSRRIWIPKRAFSEVEEIQKQQDIPRCEALNRMAEYSQIGREVEKLKERITLEDVFRHELKRGNKR